MLPFKRRTRTPIIETVKTAKPITLQALLRKKVTPTTPSREIGAAFDSFARQRIDSGNLSISRQELLDIQQRFGKGARTFLKRRGLSMAQESGFARNTKQKAQSSVKHKNEARPAMDVVSSIELGRKATQFLRDNARGQTVFNEFQRQSRKKK